ncbi:MAG: O-antigen ligase family protein [Algibacter sp.]|uniref:O-antigen ligase family protein n=1 Tax=Algibacter sp. TaxID=1872428 RepID=UPI003299A0E6
MNRLKDSILSIVLGLNATIIFIPSNFKFIPILLLLVFSIFTLIKTKKIDYRFFVFGALPYLLLIIGMIYTENLAYGLKRLETGTSLLLYPFCFSVLSTKLLKKQSNRYLNYFLVIFCLSTCIFSISIIFYFSFFEDRSLTYIIHHYNTLIDKSIHPKFQIHSIYLALYVGLSIFFSIFILFKSKNMYKKALMILSIILFLFLLVVMNKRMSIIGLVIASIISFVFSLKRLSNRKWIIMIFGTIVFSIMVIGIIKLPRFQNQNSFDEIYEIEETINNTESSIGKRLFIYSCTLELFVNKPIFGYGTGDSNDSLHLQMLKNINKTHINKYNTHNQYLSYLLSTGLIGFLIFLYYAYGLFNKAIKNQDIIFLSVLLFFFLNMLTENILEREAGVICFAFLCNLYLRKNWYNKQLKNVN